jgi:peptide/nickel transport system substrate-binding protein
MFNKEFEAAYGGWGTGADPDTSDNIWGTGQERNYVSYGNPFVDEMFVEGRKVQKDRKKWNELKLWEDMETREFLQIDPLVADQPLTREDCYAAIHALLWRDQPYTWLFYRNSYNAFNKKLRGYNFSPRGPFGYSPGFSSVWVPSDS